MNRQTLVFKTERGVEAYLEYLVEQELLPDNHDYRAGRCPEGWSVILYSDQVVLVVSDDGQRLETGTVHYHAQIVEDIIEDPEDDIIEDPEDEGNWGGV